MSSLNAYYARGDPNGRLVCEGAHLASRSAFLRVSRMPLTQQWQAQEMPDGCSPKHGTRPTA